MTRQNAGLVSALPACQDEVAGKDCFTAAQLNAIKLIYSEIGNEEGIIYPGFPFGEETDWQNFIVGPLSAGLRDNFPELAKLPSLHLAVGTEMYKYLIFQDPDWDYSSYDFSTYFHDTEYAAAYLNATSTDYSSFKEQGAKMILYQGWNDYAISAFATIDYYQEIAKRDKEVDSYLRLFLLPGVLHCSGGTGPDKTDWLALIMDWVEKGIAPERVVMSKEENGEVVMERPVFPYPAVTVYDGKGDPRKERSFGKKKEK